MMFNTISYPPLYNVLNRVEVIEQKLKPDSHRRIVKDYRLRTGKDQEILSESGGNPLKIVLKLQFSKGFWKILHRFPK